MQAGSEHLLATQRSNRTLSEHESKQLLTSYGIPVVEEALAGDPDAASHRAEEVGFPVAVKLCGSGIAHKTERGLVRLGLGDSAAVRTAARDLLGAARPEDGEVSVLVSRMMRGSRELIAGVTRDPTFGPCVMLGIGGVLAEVIGDFVFRMTPVSRLDADEMAADLRMHALLGQFRGEPAVDSDALGAVLCGLGALGAERADVQAVDVNPLIVVDGRPVAVDALVELGAM
ncbi:MAG: acetate--CoA ligase family protein [Acidimicrobiia bacterium]|nr:acetate--CoA ligase family protein [Acidimicrobiia bacterium]